MDDSKFDLKSACSSASSCSYDLDLSTNWGVMTNITHRVRDGAVRTFAFSFASASSPSRTSSAACLLRVTCRSRNVAATPTDSTATDTMGIGPMMGNIIFFWFWILVSRFSSHTRLVTGCCQLGLTSTLPTSSECPVKKCGTRPRKWWRHYEV